ncbi:hypothetical protein ACFY96_14285 [Streptomyces massasporeus]
MDEDRRDMDGRHETPYGDALHVRQIDDAGRCRVQHAQRAGVECGQPYGKVHGEVVQDSEQGPAVDSSQTGCAATASLVREHGDGGLHLLSAQLQPHERLLDRQHVSCPRPGRSGG